jgi:hypothetical protein
MKKLATLSLVGALFLGACAQQSAPEFATYQQGRIQIQAEVTPGLIDSEVRLMINGTEVINERSQAFGGSSQNFNGTWDNKQVTVRATRVQTMFSTYLLLDVFVDGTLVETLTV